MSVKIYKVEGQIRKPNYTSRFSKELRAVNPEEAIEKVYAELGGQHGIKRVHLRIDAVEELRLDEVEDPIIRALSEG
jgi:large subunit ribosomal protein LX